jgi:hypothetical protein
VRPATGSKGAVTWTRLAAAALAALVALSGCGAGAKDTADGPIGGKTLTIYASVPLTRERPRSGTLA